VSSLTRRWIKASPDAYSTNTLNNVSCFTLNACVVLCTMCRVLFDDGDRLHGSTLLYTILDVVLLLEVEWYVPLARRTPLFMN
jgi:hypothetical protein